MGREEDDLQRKRQFELCRAVDTTNLACVLGDMVDSGHMLPEMRDMFMLQAGLLRAQMVTENNRSLGF